MKDGRKVIKGYIIPDYVIDVLTGGICPDFVSMNILHESSTYVFTYDRFYYEEIRMETLETEDALEVLLALFAINKRCEDHLICADSYVLDKSSVLKRKGYGYSDGIKLLYYPDKSRETFPVKVLRLMDEVPCLNSNKRGNSWCEKIRKALSEGDLILAESAVKTAIKKICDE